MKTKMKMKNNRMLLALVMVAALAMVSVAGVAVISDDSSAETQYLPASSQPANAINGTDYFLEYGAILQIKDNAYTGTISVGVRGNGTDVADVTDSQIKLTGATNVKITAASTPAGKGTLEISNISNPTSVTTPILKVDVTLMTGTVSFTSATTGTLTSGDAKIAMVNVSGLKITAGNQVDVYGTIAAGEAPSTTWDISTQGYYSSMTISGTANIGHSIGENDKSLIVSENTELRIAEGAKVTVGAISMYRVTVDGTTTDLYTKLNAVTGTAYTVQLDGITLTQVQVDTTINMTATGIKMLLPAGDHTIVVSNEDDTKTVTIILTGVAADWAPTAVGTAIYGVGSVAASTPISGCTITAVEQQLELNAKSHLQVDGDLTAVYTDAKISGKITNAGTIDVSGTMASQNAVINTTGVTAACYQTAKTATMPLTYNYTTLANAMTKSANITVYGTMVISSDMTLTGTSAKNTITIATGAELIIGIKADPSAATPVIGKTATVTVPVTTTLTLNGTITVLNGKLITQGKITDLGTKAVADVLMKVAKDGVYTDLATALGMAASGDTVKLREAVVVLSTTAEIKSGVTLDADGKAINVAAGGKLIINGKLTKGTSVTIDAKTPNATAGELVINTKDVKLTSVALGGTITIGTGATFAACDWTIAFTDGSIINVDGILTYGATVSGTGKLTFNVSGTLTLAKEFNATGASTATVNVNVTGNMTVNEGATMYCEELTVTGKGKVISAGTFTVNTKMTVGTPATGITESINSATVTGVTLDKSNTGAYAVVYGTAANVQMPSTYDMTAFYFGKVLYATEYANGNVAELDYLRPALTDYDFGFWADQSGQSILPTIVIGPTEYPDIGDYPAVYGTTSLKTYSVTFDYNPGVTWIVDGTVMSSTSVNMLTVGVHTIKVDINPGYSGNVKMTASGNVTVSDGKLTVSGNGAVSASGVSVKDGGLDITEILLIILVVIIALLAIIVVFKMLRS